MEFVYNSYMNLMIQVFWDVTSCLFLGCFIYPNGDIPLIVHITHFCYKSIWHLVRNLSSQAGKLFLMKNMFSVTTVLPRNLLQSNPCIRHKFSNSENARHYLTMWALSCATFSGLIWNTFSFKNPHKNKAHGLIPGPLLPLPIMRTVASVLSLLPLVYAKRPFCMGKGENPNEEFFAELPNRGEALLVDLLWLRVKATRTASMFAGVRTPAGRGRLFSNTEPLVSNCWQSL